MRRAHLADARCSIDRFTASTRPHARARALQPARRPAPCPRWAPRQPHDCGCSGSRARPARAGPAADVTCKTHGTGSAIGDATVATSTPAPAAGRVPNDLQQLISQIPFMRLAIWSMIALCAYQLSDFFGIAMGTFVLSFVGNSFVLSARDNWLLLGLAPDSSTRRRIIVLLYFLAIAALVTLFGVTTIPDIAREAAEFVKRLQSDNIWVVLIEKARNGIGDHLMDNLERVVYLATSTDLSASSLLAGEPGSWTQERSLKLGMRVSAIMKGYTTTAVAITSGLLKSVTKFALQVFVSLVLSFMLVWDLPAIASGVSSLKASRLSPFYNEVAPVLAVFGKLFGKALEAQARIAVVNTALTAAGMWLLQIPSIGLLSLFVFICSFIPVAGCIISTVPIGFVALTEYGFIRLGLVILMVALVHFVEAYMLNPAIYSAHLKLHPLLVLSTLVVAEHSMGVWGLLLAVPTTVFALDYCIKYPDSSVTEVGAKELQKVLNRADEAEENAGTDAIPVLQPS